MNPISQFKDIKKFDLIPKYNFFVNLGYTLNTLKDNNSRYVSKYFECVNHHRADKDIKITNKILEMIANYRNIVFSIKAVDMPELIVNDEITNIGSTSINLPKALNTSGDLVIEFYAATNNIASKLYYLWLNLMFDFTLNIKKARNFYEADIPIFIYDRVSDFVEKRTYLGCSPRNMDKSRYDYNDDGYLEGKIITFKVNNGVMIE